MGLKGSKPSPEPAKAVESLTVVPGAKKSILPLSSEHQAESVASGSPSVKDYDQSPTVLTPMAPSPEVIQAREALDVLLKEVNRRLKADPWAFIEDLRAQMVSPQAIVSGYNTRAALNKTLRKEHEVEGYRLRIALDRQGKEARLKLVLELRRSKKTFQEIADHPDIGPVSLERARQLFSLAERMEKHGWGKHLPSEYAGTPSPVGGQAPVGVEDLDLSVRARNRLRNANIALVSDLVARSEEYLSRHPGWGKGVMTEIKDELARHGLALAVEGAKP